MIKNISILLVGFSFCAHSQSIDQQLISAGGGAIKWENGSINQALGEICIQTVHQESNVLTQGFFQSDFSPSALTNTEMDRLNIALYPNPTNDFVYLDVTEEGLTYRLFGLDGKRIGGGILNEGITQFNLADYADGMYVVEVFSEKKEIKETFKITKF